MRESLAHEIRLDGWHFITRLAKTVTFGHDLVRESLAHEIRSDGWHFITRLAKTVTLAMIMKVTPCTRDIRRVDQNHIYTVYVQYFWQVNHQILVDI